MSESDFKDDGSRAGAGLVAKLDNTALAGFFGGAGLERGDFAFGGEPERVFVHCFDAAALKSDSFILEKMLSRAFCAEISTAPGAALTATARAEQALFRRAVLVRGSVKVLAHRAALSFATHLSGAGADKLCAKLRGSVAEHRIAGLKPGATAARALSCAVRLAGLSGRARNAAVLDVELAEQCGTAPRDYQRDGDDLIALFDSASAAAALVALHLVDVADSLVCVSAVSVRVERAEKCCFACGEAGHPAKSCVARTGCSYCSATGHKFADCVKRAQRLSPTCSACAGGLHPLGSSVCPIVARLRITRPSKSPKRPARRREKSPAKKSSRAPRRRRRRTAPKPGTFAAAAASTELRPRRRTRQLTAPPEAANVSERPQPAAPPATVTTVHAVSVDSAVPQPDDGTVTDSTLVTLPPTSPTSPVPVRAFQSIGSLDSSVERRDAHAAAGRQRRQEVLQSKKSQSKKSQSASPAPTAHRLRPSATQQKNDEYISSAH